MDKRFAGLRTRIGLLPGPVTVAFVLACGACYPDEITSADETDVVLTTRRTEDFSPYSTYAMPDTVIDICEDAADPECEDALDVDHSYDAQILSQVAARMQAYGFQRVPIDQVDGANLPDLFVLVSVFATERTAYTYYPWWGWWGWGGYWPPGWGPGWGPGYGGSVSVTRWDQGTLEIDMIDPIDTDVEQQIFHVQWAATMSGVMGRTGFDTARIDRAIDQAFDQSPYLGGGAD
ncbi:MAG: DUF4136 domain-containing protein [Candidatus Palauibacterales bacterium]|nr:DUF4136 domain-containing protein [Candidatus Palauibacterales bacterium]MDP2483228.1 DUF4136 domain-containing protein [Candidatus Palauibacterales bacterium]